MIDRSPRRGAALLLFLAAFAVPPAAAETACGTAKSPPSCIAPCAANPVMIARRQKLAGQGEDAGALYQAGRSWLGIGDDATAVPVCRPDEADHRAAAEFFHRAAGKGHVEAKVALGDHWELALGGEKDYGKAFGWFQAAADQGHARALFRVGVFHDYGRAFNPSDPALASRWYSEAARRGDCDARFTLAAMYYNGRGVDRDRPAAWALYRLVIVGVNTGPCYARRSGDAARLLSRITGEIPAANRDVVRKHIARWAMPGEKVTPE